MSGRVLITRESAEPLAGMLRERGLVPVHVPLVRLFPTDAPQPVGRPEIVLVTSAVVPRFVPDLAAALGDAAVYAVGSSTAAALGECGITVTAVGTAGGAALLDLVTIDPDHSVWYVGATRPSGDMAQVLAGLDCTLSHWAVYDNAWPARSREDLAHALPVDVVTFTSGSAASRFAQDAELGAAKVAVIGERTAAEVSALGIRVDAVSEVPSMEGLAAVVRRLVDAKVSPGHPVP